MGASLLFFFYLSAGGLRILNLLVLPRPLLQKQRLPQWALLRGK